MSYVKQPFVWSHDQELDRLELGERPARYIKGENLLPRSRRARLIAGRAHGAIEPALVQERRERSLRVWRSAGLARQPVGR